jgi:ParB/RepB/Spo0J family partition protein
MAQPILVHAPLSQLLKPLHDIRDRDTASYREFLARLADDLKDRGMQVPILAYREGDKFRIIDGLTRFCAALLAMLETIPVLVYAEKPDEAALILGQLLANSMRRDNTVLELAAVYQDLKRLNGWNDATLARHVHASPGHVAKVLSISAKLCEPCKAMVASGELQVKAAYAISRIADHQLQLELAQKAKSGLLCAQGVEGEVARLISGKKPRTKPALVKVRLPGLMVIFTDCDTPKARVQVGQLDAGLAKLEKNQLPLQSLPQMLKPTA